MKSSSDEKKNLTEIKNKLHDALAEIDRLKIDYQAARLANRNNEIYLYNILNADIPVTFYWMDTNSTVLGCSKMQATLFGLNSQEEFIGKDVYFLGKINGWSKEICDEIRKNDIEVMTTGKTISREEEVYLKDSKRIFLSYKNPLVSETGDILGVFGFSIDITDRKKFEQDLKSSKEAAEAANVAKTEFLQNMSHDIRTPLAGIIGMTYILERSSKDVEEKKDLHDIHEAGNSLLNLLTEIIQTARLDSGKVMHTETCFSLKFNIAEIADIFKPAISHKGVEFKINYDSSIPEVLYGNILLLHRILLNLLGNAVKFTENGSIHLDVSMVDKKEENVKIKIAIKDTGIGIPKDKQEVIFDKFAKLTPSNTNKYKGSGLGLYIVKQFVSVLNGDISVKSEPGSGSEFTCVIPFSIPTADQLHKYKPEKEGEEMSMPQTKLSILLVEDTLLARRVAENLLTTTGYSVATATTMAECIQKSREQKYDLILMDVGLPDGTGHQATEIIRTEHDNPNATTCIVALTAHEDADTKKRCLDSGMQEVLYKPLTAENIKEFEKYIHHA